MSTSAQKIKIAYIVRDNFFVGLGGDTIQATKTKEYIELQNQNIKIDIFPYDKISIEELKKYDICHVWGISVAIRGIELLRQYKSLNKKIVLSSIYWSTDQLNFSKFFINPIMRYNTFAFFEWLYNFYNKFILLPCAYIIPKYRKLLQFVFASKDFKKIRTEIVNLSDMVVPNSEEEAQLFCKNIGLNYKQNKQKFFIVPNAVDINYINNHDKKNDVLPNVNDFVIQSARIEPSKNHYNLLKALYNVPEIPIIFAGAIRNEDYYLALKKIADKRGNVYFTGLIDSDNLYSLYKRARIHVLASFRETTGLSTLEALSCGCQIVVSNKHHCPINYYKFDKYGYVCNPYSVSSIKEAILKAYYKPKNIILDDDYKNFFNYENAARMTANAYCVVLNSKYKG